MPVRSILVWPEPALSTPAKPVVAFDAALRQLVDDMFETMYAEDGIGLAANQVGVLQEVVVIDLDPTRRAEGDAAWRDQLKADRYKGPVACINPRIVSAHGNIVWEEGCLSLPDIKENVKRHAHVVVEAQRPDGTSQTLEASGLFAVCLQHEIDHLAGRMFLYYLSKLKRDVIRRKMLRHKATGGAPDPNSQPA